MGQGGGVSQEEAPAAEGTGPLLLCPVCLLRCPPVPGGESGHLTGRKLEVAEVDLM